MARPSNRAVRRQEIVLALERVLAGGGLGGATIAAVAEEADLAPVLAHHHFKDKEELFAELTASLYRRFREAAPRLDLRAGLDAALRIRGPKSVRAARAWVGLFAEGLRSVTVRGSLRRISSAELRRLDAALMEAGLARKRAEQVAAGLRAFVLGSLVLGAILLRTRQGFAAMIAQEMVDGFIDEGRSTTSPRPVR